MGRIAIAFVDDHPALLDGLVGIFGGDRFFKVVAKGSSASDAMQISSRFRLDVLVLDLNMPGDAFDAIASISRTAPDTKIVAFTASTGIDAAVKALEAGASGYVLKGSTADELRGAIGTVLKGETFITQGFASKVITALRTTNLRQPNAIKLTLREEQIVKLLLCGKTNKEIAGNLKISDKTVKNYMTVLMQKLQVRNRLEAVIAAQKLAQGPNPATDSNRSAYLN